ncbi:hypothetical protein [Nocardia sp. NBC_00416]|uniref:hypothetical protein n=1 Tax=Nocardia sp. NBC_00416 TaxID=2975991 RepID=UPI002E205371
MRPYPIAAQSVLRPVSRRGLRRRTRTEYELLFPAAHEVLVYRVHGDFVLDDGALGANDRTVLDATHVSLVDLSVDKPLEVDLRVSACDGGMFTVRVMFRCTVTDPVAVVRDGRSNAAVPLAAHLGSLSGIPALGHRLTVDEVGPARARLGAEIAELLDRNPPAEPGMRITVSSVAIQPPAEVTTSESGRRALRRDSAFAGESDDFEHALALRTVEHEYELWSKRRRLSSSIDDETLRRKRELAEVEAGTVRWLADQIGENPERALILALVREELSPADLTERLLDHRQAVDRHQAEREKKRWSETVELRRRHLDVLEAMVNRGVVDTVGVDPEVMDTVFGNLFESLRAALVTTATAELPAAGPAEAGESTVDEVHSVDMEK